ncbi:MAG: FAD-binding protein [Chloroflexi bacterium]|nr:FAD-binding protein [Chloroflexota bacterium]
MIERSIVTELEGIVGKDRVLTSPEELAVYAYDGTFYEGRPDVVVMPLSAPEVSKILQLAVRERIPVVPRGAGTGLAGGSVPVHGGIILNLAMMNKILEIDGVNSVAVAQPGVVTGDLQNAVEQRGLFYPPDPASLKQCTIGGNVAMNGGGPRGLKYGVTKDYVLGLEVVLPSGDILRLGGKSIKNVTGYSLMQLFVGSEGTLGVVTEVTVKLLPLPKARSAALVVFPSMERAAGIVNTILGAGVVPSTIEIMDDTTIKCVEAYLRMGLPLDVEALIIVEVDGDETSVASQLEAVAQICLENGARSVTRATTARAIDEVWLARRSVSPSLARMRPSKLGEDISVPRSAILPVVKSIQEIGRRNELTIAVFGHISDGNLHPNILFDRRDPDEMQRVEKASREIFAAAVGFGGTLSGEHGIGLLKREFLPLDLSPQVIEAMRAVKSAFDPHNILNPGKVFPN